MGGNEECHEDGSGNRKAADLYTLLKPMRRRAGSYGDKEIFFNCGECKAKEPVIYGYLAFGPKYQDIAVRQEKNGSSHLLFLCEKCYQHYAGTRNRAGGEHDPI